MKQTSVLLFIALMISFNGLLEAKPKWVSLFMILPKIRTES